VKGPRISISTHREFNPGWLLLLVFSLTAVGLPAAVSFDCDTWQPVNPLPVQDDLNKVAYGNGTFVAVGDSGTILVASNEVNWTEAQSPKAEDLNDVIGLGDVLLATGDNAPVVTGELGGEWKIVATATEADLHDLAIHGESIIVAVGAGGTIMRSHDLGDTWTLSESGTAADLRGVAWTGAGFMAVGNQGTILTSPDGATWSAPEHGFVTDLTDVASNGVVTVAATNGRWAVTTGDGSWTQHDYAGSVTDIVWAGDRFLAAGDGDPRYSHDGTTWRNAQCAIPGVRSLGLSAAAHGMPYSVAVGAGGAILFSKNQGENWKPANTSIVMDVECLAGNETTFVAAAGGKHGCLGTILVSSDLTNWSVAKIPGPTSIWDVAAGHGSFLALGLRLCGWHGGQQVILTSIDGHEWHKLRFSWNDWPNNLTSVIWDGSRWVVAGDHLMISADGETWQAAALDGYFSYWGLASNGTLTVAVGHGGEIAVLDQSNVLTRIPSPTDSLLVDVEWGNGVFVAVGRDGTVLTSLDGSSWEEQPPLRNPALRGVRWTGGALVPDWADLRRVRWTGAAFVIVGQDGTAFESVDGRSWQALDLGTGTDLNDILVNSTGAVAGGDNGLILRNLCAAEDGSPNAHFVWHPNRIVRGSTIRFNDISTGDPTSWTWDFGDGGEAHTPVVDYVFEESGEWPVGLVVANANGDAFAATNLTVHAECGPQPVEDLEAPESVASDGPYVISWNDPFESWETGHYRLQESRQPSFADYSNVVTGYSGTSFEISHSWSEGSTFFYRVRSENLCPDGTYSSPYSPVKQVHIRPDTNELGHFVRVIPAAASGPGLAGTSWVTNVEIFNATTGEAPVYLVFLPREGEASLGARLEVAAGAAIHLEDALSAFGDPVYGAIAVVSDRPLFVTSHSVNQHQAGGFGQLVPGVAFEESLGTESAARLIHLSENDSYRSNLALANSGPEEVTAEIQFFDAGNTHIGTGRYDLPALSSVMVPQVLRHFTGEAVDDAFALIASEGPGKDLVAMASLVDNRSGDPMTLLPMQSHDRSRAVTVAATHWLTQSSWVRLVALDNAWYLVGNAGIARSEDGLTWDLVVDLRDLSTGVRDVAYDGDQLIAVGNRIALSSADGISWTSISLPHDYFHSITWNGAIWLAAGIETGPSTAIVTSFDGIDWQREDIQDLLVNSIQWSVDRYFYPHGRRISFSFDGLNWQTGVIDVPVSHHIESVAWSGSQFLAVFEGAIAQSVDGVNWIVQPVDWLLWDVVWAGDRWVVSGKEEESEKSVFAISFDGTDWNEVERPGFHDLADRIAWNGSNVLAVDDHGMASFLVIDSEVMTVPAAAHASGYGDARWLTDLEIHNPGYGSLHGTIEYFRRDAATLPPESRVFMLEGSTSQRFGDVVGSLFGADGAGALRIKPLEGSVMVSSRTYNDTEDGSYGQLVPGLRAADAVWFFESGRLLHLSHSPDLDSGYRCNIGLVSNCGRAMNVEIDLHLANGDRIGTEWVELPTYGVTQLNNVFDGHSTSAISGAFASVSTTTPGCSFFAYASVVDNQTHDPILMTAVPWNESFDVLPMPD